MKAIKIIISIAALNILLVAGIAYFSTFIENMVGSDTSLTSTIQTQNTTSTTINSAPTKPTQTTPPPPTTAPSVNRCIVTISGKRYDVQPLRKPHSGGDIFVCNTDMTDIFFGQHDQSLLNEEMQKYRLP